MRECGWCGVRITPKRADAKFCSPAHRIYAHRAKKNAGGIPVEMIRRDRWVRYAPDKTPLRTNGRNASSTDPKTWSSHQEAAASRAGIGLGFVLGDGIGCIDLDHVLEHGKPTVEAAEFLTRYPHHYIEISPSGTGLHIWGTTPEAPGTRRKENGISVERYSTGRYITITGDIYQPGDLLPL